jgi:hypothetical protein
MSRGVLWFSFIVLTSSLGALLVGLRIGREGRANAGVLGRADDWVADLAIAPNPVAPGRSDVFLLSTRALPDAIVAEPASDGVVLEEVRALSAQVVKLTLQVDGSAPDVSLRMKLGSEEVAITLQVGAKARPVAIAANIPEDAILDGRLLTGSPIFVYGYEAALGPEWYGTGILNETTGTWHLRRAEAVPGPEPELLEVDTDGDGVLDRDDTEDAAESRADFIGLELIEGVNHLHIVTFTRTGFSSLEDLLVEYVKS